MLLNHNHCGFSPARKPIILGGEQQNWFMVAIGDALRGWPRSHVGPGVCHVAGTRQPRRLLGRCRALISCLWVGCMFAGVLAWVWLCPCSRPCRSSPSPVSGLAVPGAVIKQCLRGCNWTGYSLMPGSGESGGYGILQLCVWPCPRGCFSLLLPGTKCVFCKGYEISLPSLEIWELSVINSKELWSHQSASPIMLWRELCNFSTNQQRQTCFPVCESLFFGEKIFIFRECLYAVRGTYESKGPQVR